MLTESLIELELIDRFSTLPGAYGRDIHNLIRVFAGAKLKLLPNLLKISLTMDKEDWYNSDPDFNKCSKNGVEFCIQMEWPGIGMEGGGDGGGVSIPPWRLHIFKVITNQGSEMPRCFKQHLFV
jgi:hypothetical protein